MSIPTVDPQPLVNPVYVCQPGDGVAKLATFNAPDGTQVWLPSGNTGYGAKYTMHTYSVVPSNGTTIVAAPGGGNWIADDLNPNINQTTVGADTDFNSLILGDVAADEWSRNGAGNLYTMPNASNVYGLTLDGFLDGVWLNSVQANVSYVLSQPFSPDATTTAVQFEMDAALPSGVSSSTVVIAITTANQGSVLASKSCVLTSTAQTFVAGPLAVTPGTIYQAVIYFGATTNGASASSSVLVSRVRVRPTTTSSSLLGNPFVRYNASQRLLWGNNKFGISTTILSNWPMRRQSPYARFCFWTNAAQIGVQGLNTVTATLATAGNIVVHVNGRPYATFQGANNNAANVNVVTLPGGYNYVEVEGSDQSKLDVNNDEGNFILSVMAPLQAYFVVQPRQQPQQTIYWIYDSKGGYGSTNPTLNGLIPLLRRAVPYANFVHDGAASRQVNDVAGTLASAQQFAARIVQAHPTTVIWYGLHRNDWAQDSFTPIQVRTMVEMVIDIVHAAAPEVNFVLISTPSELTESANGLGYTLQNYRDACTLDVASARPTFCSYINGNSSGMAGWSNGTCLAADNVHPNNLGYQVLFENLITNATLFDNPIPLAGIFAQPNRQYTATPAIAASGGTYAPVLVPAAQLTSNTSIHLDVTVMLEDSAGNTALFRNDVLVQNKAGTVTVANNTSLVSFDTNLTSSVAYSISSGALVCTVTNSSTNTAHVKVHTAICEPMQ